MSRAHAIPICRKRISALVSFFYKSAEIHGVPTVDTERCGTLAGAAKRAEMLSYGPHNSCSSNTSELVQVTLAPAKQDSITRHERYLAADPTNTLLRRALGDL